MRPDLLSTTHISHFVKSVASLFLPFRGPTVFCLIPFFFTAASTPESRDPRHSLFAQTLLLGYVLGTDLKIEKPIHSNSSSRCTACKLKHWPTRSLSFFSFHCIARSDRAMQSPSCHTNAQTHADTYARTRHQSKASTLTSPPSPPSSHLVFPGRADACRDRPTVPCAIVISN